MNGQKPVEKENRGRTGGDGDDDDDGEERENGDTLVRGVGLSFSGAASRRGKKVREAAGETEDNT